MTQLDPVKPKIDTRRAQAVRVADYLELNPCSTVKEIDLACDVGSVTKLLSEMRCMGYGIGRAWRWHDVLCAGGQPSRHVRTYVLIHRPADQHDLLNPQ